MLPAAALIATLLSAGPWSNDVAATGSALPADGFYAGFSAGVMSDLEGTGEFQLSSMIWGSVQLGWSFGDTVFHGPELEAGWWQYVLAGPEDGPAQTTRFHCGAGYRFGFDLLRARSAAVFVAGRVSAGAIGLDDPLSDPLATLYLQGDATFGFRLAAGAIRVRFGLGPAFGLYVKTPFAQLQASFAIEL